MGKFIVFGTLVLLLIIVVLACLYGYDLFRRWRLQRANSKWTLEEHSTPLGYLVQLEKHGEEPIVIDRIDATKNQDEFDWDLRYARSEGQQRLLTQNDPAN